VQKDKIYSCDTITKGICMNLKKIIIRITHRMATLLSGYFDDMVEYFMLLMSKQSIKICQKTLS
jgi:hypothetical protein